jgi:pyruvate dehydrogenase E2 component (dihydrolipoamide acetyltransferase)
MVSGTVSEWKIEEGSAFQAGDSIAEIQTDKASIAFEAQDDGYIAKHLVTAGTEVNVGEPIMVTVEDEEYVKAFADFVLPLPSVAATTKSQQEVPKGETPKVTVTIPPPQVLPPAVSAATASPPPSLASAPSVSVPPPSPPNAPSISLLNNIATSSLAVSSTPSWGKLAKSSPIAKILRASQQTYIDTYGLTGQKPL